MDEKNRQRWGFDLKNIAILAWGVLTIITCVAVWNSGSDAFTTVMSILLLLANGYAIYRVAKMLSKEDKR